MPPDSISAAIEVSPHWDVTAREMRGIKVAEDAGLEDGKVARLLKGCAHWSHDLAEKISIGWGLSCLRGVWRILAMLRPQRPEQGRTRL